MERLDLGEPEAPSRALFWDGRQPEALYRRAVALADQDQANASTLLTRAYGENPADARPLIAAAPIFLAQEEQARADALVEAAVALMPADTRIHQQAALCAVSRGDLKDAMRHWSLAMEANPTARREIFPLLRKLAEDPRTRMALEPFATSPPSWWETFFTEIASNASDPATVHVLYLLRREAWQAPITAIERESSTARLMKEGSLDQAFILRINSLTPEQRKELALLHDGGFELEPGNWGFDWRLRSSPLAEVGRTYTFGSHEEKSLLLQFNRHEGPFDGVSQSLFLPPGTYRLSGQIRTDSLDTAGGLKWVVRCVRPERSDLGESPRFLGSNEWRSFGFEFRVPESCRLQETRLISAGKGPLEQTITGAAWFDNMSIRDVAKKTNASGEPGAKLVRIEGEAIVNKGARYVGGTERTTLAVGDRVLVLAGGRAIVGFGDGCNYLLDDSRIFTVSAQSPCIDGPATESRAAELEAEDGIGLSLSSAPPAPAVILSILGDSLSASDTLGENPPPLSP